MVPKLALRAVHESHGARFAERNGAEVVVDYGSPETELRSLRETVGVADRSQRGQLVVIGPEAKLFLHGMVTNDVNGLVPGTGNLSAVIESRGKMLGDCRVWLRAEDCIWIDMDASARENVAEHLSRYLVSEDCELYDQTEERALFGVWGPRASDALERALGQRPPRLAENQQQQVSVGEIDCLLVGSRAFGVEGYEIVVGAGVGEAVWSALVLASREHGGGPVGDDALDTLRIQHGLPRWGADMDEATIPLEANLQTAISYTKGCYVGQEVIAKATYRGRVRRKLVRFRLEKPAEPGASVYDGDKLVGTLTSVVAPWAVGDGSPLALGYLRHDRLEKGKRLELEGGGEAIVDWVPEEEGS